MATETPVAAGNKSSAPAIRITTRVHPVTGARLTDAEWMDYLETRNAELESSTTQQPIDGRLVIYAVDKEAATKAGIKAEQADERRVYTRKPTATNKLKAPIEVSLRDLCSATGFAICRVDGEKVSAVWGNGPNFGKPMPVSLSTLQALRTLIGGRS